MDKINEAIKRIEYMERLFNFLLSVPLSEKEKFLKERKELEDYYESSLWREDFLLDEKGLLPKDLKRGVLSQDGVYDLLSDIDILLKTSIHASYRKGL